MNKILMNEIFLLFFFIFIIFLLYCGCLVSQKEKFCSAYPLEMNKNKEISDGNVLPNTSLHAIIPETCNRIPLLSKGLSPLSLVKEQKYPFEQLANKSGIFTFMIPEFKYDGIWSRKTNDCCWTLSSPYSSNLYFPENIKTYGSNQLSPIPEKSMFGKTIIQPPECAGLWPIYTPPIIINNDC
jgi:hypothetical protein